MESKIEVTKPSDWNLENVRTLLAQSVLSLIQASAERLMSDENQKKAWD